MHAPSWSARPTNLSRWTATSPNRELPRVDHAGRRFLQRLENRRNIITVRHLRPRARSVTAVEGTRWRRERAAAVASQTADGLDRLAVAQMPLRPLDFVISAFQLVEILTRHLDWEDETLLTLATTRHDEEDMRSFGSAMARRRGVSPPLPWPRMF